MSGTAPTHNDPTNTSRGGGLQNEPTDKTRSQTSNMLDEEKGESIVDKNIGEAIDAGRNKQGLTGKVDELINQSAAATGTERKSNAKNETGFKVGGDGDGDEHHDLAASKQP